MHSTVILHSSLDGPNNYISSAACHGENMLVENLEFI